jgi:hypothetical protein
VQNGLVLGADVAGGLVLAFGLVVVGPFLGTDTLLEFTLPKLAIRAIGAVAVAVDGEGVVALAFLRVMAPDVVVGADALFEFGVPGSGFGTGLALSLGVAVGVSGVAVAAFLLRVEDLSGILVVVVAGQTLLPFGEPVLGQFADLAITIFFSVNSRLVLTHALVSLQDLQGVRAPALLVDFHQGRPAVADLRALLLNPVLRANAPLQFFAPVGSGLADTGNSTPLSELALALLAPEVHPQFGRWAVNAVFAVS